MKRHFQNRDENILNGQDEHFLACLVKLLRAASSNGPEIVFGSVDEFSKNVPVESFPAE